MPPPTPAPPAHHQPQEEWMSSLPLLPQTALSLVPTGKPKPTALYPSVKSRPGVCFSCNFEFAD